MPAYMVVNWSDNSMTVETQGKIVTSDTDLVPGGKVSKQHGAQMWHGVIDSVYGMFYTVIDYFLIS